MHKLLFILGMLLTHKAAGTDIVLRESEVLRITTIPYEQMIGRAFQLRAQELLARNPSELNIVLDSTGGSLEQSVREFMVYLDGLVANGTRVSCFIDKQAYSAAAMIFSHCSHRYSTPQGTILWHAARWTMKINYTAKDFASFAVVAQRFDERQWNTLRLLVNDDKFWDENFSKESKIKATELAISHPNVLQIVNLEIKP